MNDRASVRVLDVGQCGFDHGNINRLLQDRFGAEVDQAHDLDEALQAAATGAYTLVLVNRIFDANGAEGLDLVRRLKDDDRTAQTPVMLVSNFDDAQRAAIELGAERGFGKDSLNEVETAERLAEYLGR